MNSASQLLMIRPVCFGFNEQTASDNFFRKADTCENAQERALEEFDEMVRILRSRDLSLLVLQDSAEPETPDSIFPNNWVSTHSDGTLVLYPMAAPNRRAERKAAVIKGILEATGANRILDLSFWEKEGEFLESTGSLVLDRASRMAYACLSPRTSATVLADFCRRMDYTPVPFHAFDRNGHAIYHTNVMMSLGRSFAIICKEAFSSEEEWKRVKDQLQGNGKTVVEFSLDQMGHFVGNILEVENKRGERLLLMSQSAFQAMQEDQLAILSREDTLVPISIPTIEAIGGGSVRCMLAELFSH